MQFDATFRHVKNIYDTKTYYFFTPNQGHLLAAGPQSSGGAATTTINTFDDYAVLDDDKQNLITSGRTMYGTTMNTSAGNTQSGTFSFSNMTADPALFRSSVAMRSFTDGPSMTLRINGTALFTHTVSAVNPSFEAPFADVNQQQDRLAVSGNISYNYTFSSSDNSAQGWVDYLEVNVKRQLIHTGTYMPFRSAASVGASAVSTFELGNAPSNIAVWDVTDVFNVRAQQTSLSGSTQTFTLSTPYLREFISFDAGNIAGFAAPTFVEKIENQDIHALADVHPTMVIVSPKALLAPAQELANWHTTTDHIYVAVVEAEKIYNEFGGGANDISAIRDFMRMLYERAGSSVANLPKYLLIYGDGSYDAVNGRTQANTFIIPTYESFESLDPSNSYCTDDYYGFLDRLEGGSPIDGDLLDIAVGRFTVNSVEEARGVNNKIYHYKSDATLGNWRNAVTFIADDQDNDIHIHDCDEVAESVRTRYPDYNVDKIYLDAFRQVSTPAGDRYPDVNTAIKNKLFQGTLTMAWVGHGGVQRWAHEDIFDVTDINALENFDKLPLFLTATCEFSKFDDPAVPTAGEMLLTNPRGGGIGLVTTVRLVYTSQNKVINDALFSHLFEPQDGRMPTVGEVVMHSKNEIAGDDNNRKFTLLGDPALTLDYPAYDVVTKEMDGKIMPAQFDTMRALAKVTIKGEIHDLAGHKMTNFNGTVYPTVFDKKESLHTLVNDPGGLSPSSPFTFGLQKNAIYKGKVTVANGEFSFSFIVPKDIDYNIGIGKVSYYAENGSIDAHGYSYNGYVGGVADSHGVDLTGPTIELFMKDEKWVSGGLTDQNPILLVKLQDENGINTAGIGIGHDISCILDNNDKNKLALNDFYEAELNSYQKGKVRYPFRKLADGRHTLKVKAWDVYNNSSEAVTEFIVASSPDIALSHVLNYPNPFTTSTNFMFEHNRPGDEIDVTIQIFTVSGKVVKTLHEKMVTDGYRVDNLHWDGRDEYGDKIGRGVYVYKVNVRGSDGNSAHQFEKLVLLQ